MLTFYLISAGVCLVLMISWFYFSHYWEPLTVGILTGFIVVSLIPIFNIIISVILLGDAIVEWMGETWDKILESNWMERFNIRLGKFMDITLIKPRK